MLDYVSSQINWLAENPVLSSLFIVYTFLANILLIFLGVFIGNPVRSLVYREYISKYHRRSDRESLTDKIASFYYYELISFVFFSQVIILISILICSFRAFKDAKYFLLFTLILFVLSISLLFFDFLSGFFLFLISKIKKRFQKI
jgi:hypothetical protein